MRSATWTSRPPGRRSTTRSTARATTPRTPSRPPSSPATSRTGSSPKSTTPPRGCCMTATPSRPSSRSSSTSSLSTGRLTTSHGTSTNALCASRRPAQTRASGGMSGSWCRSMWRGATYLSMTPKCSAASTPSAPSPRPCSCGSTSGPSTSTPSTPPRHGRVCTTATSTGRTAQPAAGRTTPSPTSTGCACTTTTPPIALLSSGGRTHSTTPSWTPTNGWWRPTPSTSTTPTLQGRTCTSCSRGWGSRTSSLRCRPSVRPARTPLCRRSTRAAWTLSRWTSCRCRDPSGCPWTARRATRRLSRSRWSTSP
mmetsp:Transcript_31997/g.79352  ORF Transcript_31997/g.79352 Transcript_31997/m.79352 type:complete len:310 (-) Transcript_31997:711-1640(-)